MSKMKLLVAIPAYNESEVIGNVIRQIPNKVNGVTTINKLVVDDGSIDNTKDIAIKNKVIVVRHIINRGLGGALKTIFAYAKTGNFDILITLDADGQHNPGDIPHLIQPLITKNTDVVIGTRWTTKHKAPISRVVVNTIANIFTYLMCGVYISDSQSGYRVFGKKAIQKINVQTDGMEVSSEIFREIKRNSLTVAEVPIEAIYTKYSKGKGQKISDAPDVFFRLLLRIIR